MQNRLFLIILILKILNYTIIILKILDFENKCFLKIFILYNKIIIKKTVMLI